MATDKNTCFAEGNVWLVPESQCSISEMAEQQEGKEEIPECPLPRSGCTRQKLRGQNSSMKWTKIIRFSVWPILSGQRGLTK